MIEDNYNILKILKENNKTININKIENIIIEGFKSEILTKTDNILLELVFSENPKQADLDNF